MTNDNPWRVLASRVGVYYSRYGVCLEEAVSWPDGERLHDARLAYETVECQDLLIGMALRVAGKRWTTWSRNEDSLALKASVFGDGDSRATFALALLDAVGYNPPS